LKAIYMIEGRESRLVDGQFALEAAPGGRRKSRPRFLAIRFTATWTMTGIKKIRWLSWFINSLANVFERKKKEKKMNAGTIAADKMKQASAALSTRRTTLYNPLPYWQENKFYEFSSPFDMRQWFSYKFNFHALLRFNA